jgi:hypothetical protein
MFQRVCGIFFCLMFGFVDRFGHQIDVIESFLQVHKRYKIYVSIRQYRNEGRCVVFCLQFCVSLIQDDMKTILWAWYIARPLVFLGGVVLPT